MLLYFQATRQIRALDVRLDGSAGDEGWRVLMDRTGAKEATGAPSWAPGPPGGLGSERGH